jgi:hypothetical protein
MKPMEIKTPRNRLFQFPFPHRQSITQIAKAIRPASLEILKQGACDPIVVELKSIGK